MLIADLARVFVRDIETFQREIELFPDDRLLWEVRPGVTNSAGNLAAHVAGNLQHFVGAVLSKSGYVRQRDREFNRREGTRAELIADLGAAIDVITTYLPGLNDADLARPFPEPVGGVQMTTSMFLMHLSAHTAFHLGQAGYLRRIVTADGTVSGTMALKPLA